jgi:hypothetical protein
MVRALWLAVVVLVGVVIAGCSDAQRAKDGGVAQSPRVDAGATMEPMRAADAAVTPAADGGLRFESIGVEKATCTPTRANIAIGLPERVFVTTGCGFYRIDTARRTAEQLAPQGETSANDGATVAVIADDLGLSLDGGNTFVWTAWSLVRCMGTPNVNAGAGLALVSCVAGVGRWRGQGTTFEVLQPGGTLPIAPSVATHGPHVVINTVDGWFHSDDSGDHFEAFGVAGLPGSQPGTMVIIDSQLFVTTVLDQNTESEQTALFSAQLGGGAFERVTSLPELKGPLLLDHNEETLLVVGAGRLLISSDSGQSFSELEIEGMPQYVDAAKYSAGRIFVMAGGTLYVATL